MNILQIMRQGICLLRITTGKTQGYSVAIDVFDFKRRMVEHPPSRISFWVALVASVVVVGVVFYVRRANGLSE